MTSSFSFDQKIDHNNFFQNVNQLRTMDTKPPRLTISELENWLHEDAQYGDVTSEAIIPATDKTKAVLRARKSGIVAGIPIISQVLDYLGIDYTIHINDGSNVVENDKILSLGGNTREILLIERLILNFLTHLSGIATQVANMVAIVAKNNGTAKIAATRKTLPGLRKYQKYAVKIAGGATHRFSLSDCLLIKDNHIQAAGNVSNALQLALENKDFTKRIDIEVETMEDALLAAEMGADIIMLDNMQPEEIQLIHNALIDKGLRKKVILEISGGINPANLKDYTSLPIDIISMGSLTHSVIALDLGLDF